MKRPAFEATTSRALRRGRVGRAVIHRHGGIAHEYTVTEVYRAVRNPDLGIVLHLTRRIGSRMTSTAWAPLKSVKFVKRSYEAGRK